MIGAPKLALMVSITDCGPSLNAALSFMLPRLGMFTQRSRGNAAFLRQLGQRINFGDDLIQHPVANPTLATTGAWAVSSRRSERRKEEHRRVSRMKDRG